MLMRVRRQLATEAPLTVAVLTAVAVGTAVSAGLHPLICVLTCGLGLIAYNGVVTLARESRQRRREEASPERLVGMREWERLQWEEVGRELDRSRRHGRSFVLLRVIGAGAGLNGSARHHRAEDLYRDAVRSIDRVWTRRGDVYLLLPECTRAMAVDLVQRLAHETSDLVTPDQVSIAAFPEDGVTQGALLRVLDGVDDDRTPALEAVATFAPQPREAM
jgi:hypothetical protein